MMEDKKIYYCNGEMDGIPGHDQVEMFVCPCGMNVICLVCGRGGERWGNAPCDCLPDKQWEAASEKILAQYPNLWQQLADYKPDEENKK